MSASGHRLQLLPDDIALEIAPTQTVLDALRHAGVDWPRLCRTGTCRECLAHLRAGQIRYCVDWPGLSADEHRAGAVLPCVALALTDLVIAR